MSNFFSEENYPTLSLQTNTREQLIDLSRLMGTGINQRFLLDPKNIPYINIFGTNDGGKSLIVEAIMKQLMDGHDAADMKDAQAIHEMFMETRPAQAWHRYLKRVAHSAGKEFLCAYDRKTIYRTQDRLLNAFRKAAKEEKVSPQGIIIASGVGHELSDPWLVITMDGEDEWNRTITFEVRNKHLFGSQTFQQFWSRLESYRNTGIMREVWLQKEAAFPLSEFFSKEAGASMSGTASLDALELYKFLYWNHGLLRSSRQELALLTANLAENGDKDLYNQACSWLKEVGDETLLKDISDLRFDLKAILRGAFNFERKYFDVNSVISSMQQVNALSSSYEGWVEDINDYIAQISVSENWERLENFKMFLPLIYDEEQREQLADFQKVDVSASRNKAPQYFINMN